jgi:uncharacterized protein
MDLNLSLLVIMAYILLGAVAGIIGGLLGLGGGIVIVPALLYLFIQQGFSAEIQMHLAVATSLTTIIFTSMASTWSHHRHGAVYWEVVAYLVPGIVIGCVLGALTANNLRSETLRIAFGLFELLVAIQVGLGLKPSGKRQLPGNNGMVFTGGVIGTMSTILGIGGGTLTVPFLLWCNVNIRNAVATSAACGLPIAAVGALSFIITGWNHYALPQGSTGYVYWPAALAILVTSILTAPLGVRLAHILPVTILRRIFALVLAIVGIRMLI